MARARKGISPVIATVIIVAVAIAISIAVGGWLMGLWGTFGSTESLKVMPNSTLIVNQNGNGTLTVYVKNMGSKPAKITEVDLSNGYKNATLDVVINPGEVKPVVENVDVGKVTPGAQYTIKVYTDAGNVYSGYVVAQSG